MSEENRFTKNKKITIVVVLIGIVFGASAGVMTGLYINVSNKYADLSGNYDELLDDFNELTLTQIETLCNADTYVNDMEPDSNFGNEQYWYAGSDEYTWEYFVAFFNFSLSDKPENYEKVEIQLKLSIYSEGVCLPVKFFQQWDENTITFNNMPTIDYEGLISFSINYNIITYSMSMIIDVTEWVNTGVDSLSIAFLGGDYYEGYSREHPNQDVVPKLVWTVIEASV